ncbi:MAG: DUF192 domain-containing protein [Terriglobales bacterium]
MSAVLAHPLPAFALNRTKQVFLATELRCANRFLSRLRGLLLTRRRDFAAGCGLWITPSKGVHMFGMSYPIDAVYLDGQQRVVHVHPHLRPWQVAAIRADASSVLELPDGTIARTRTELGDQICIQAQP